VTQDLLADALSDDQRRVIPWLPARISFAAIGARIGMSGAAVEELATALYRQLSVHTRQEAVDRCAQLGLFSERQPDLQSAVENLDEPFFQMKALRNARGEIVDFEYLYCNRAALGVLNRGREDVIGHYLLELFPARLTDGLFDALVHVTETGEPLRQELVLSKGCVAGEFEVVASRHGDGFVLASRDIGARKRRERELTLVGEQLQQALTSRVLIEQAKGFMTGKFGIEPDTAFDLLRRHARNHNQRLQDVARSVVAGEMELDIPATSAARAARVRTKNVVRRS